jgi:BirA family transcriptional regulator, biotin operon repressor / biotin---[acetyl-CoA-carboxylase] ligase
VAVKKGSTRQSPLIDDFHLLSYESVDSTNDEARRLAEGGGSHGAFIWAREQTSGRGRMGRNWISHEGNLFVSVLLSPGQKLAELPQLSIVTALAAAVSIAPLLPNPQQVRCKWPNDILVGGKKVGGILLESFETTESDGSKKRWVVTGLGINVESCPDEVMHPATFLKNEGVELVSAKIVLSRFIHHFIECYQRWQDEGFEPIREDWLELAEAKGKQIKVQLPEESVSGIFKGMDKSGNLELEIANGKKRVITAGDVSVL